MGREEALASGALAFFGDKYGERVRVVEVPGFSKEFCGGTHVGSTGEIGLFLLTNEQGISAGTRRVEAITGEAAVARAQADQGILEELEQAAKVDRRELVDEYAKLREQLKAREREIQSLRLKLATGAGAAAGEDLSESAGRSVWTPRHEGLDRKGTRRGGRRLPQPPQGPALRARLDLGRGRGCERDQPRSRRAR